MCNCLHGGVERAIKIEDTLKKSRYQNIKTYLVKGMNFYKFTSWPNTDMKIHIFGGFHG